MSSSALSSSRFILLTVLALIMPHVVLSHGNVNKIVIGENSFKGNTPRGKEKDSMIRLVNTIDPVKGTDNPSIVCGKGAHPAQLVGDAQPGDDVEIHWVGGGGESWPHNTGPMLTYLANCDGDCSKFNTDDAKWFKIQQVGKKGNSWVQKQLMDGTPAKLSLPKSLAAGSYIMRHEVIGLHLAVNKGGAEFYPSCSQINVGGNQKGAPKESELVSFPGAYSEDDAGIFVPKVFDNNLDYEFPGPKIASFVNDQEGASSASESDDSSSSGSQSEDSGSDSPSVSGKTASSKCSRKKRSTTHKTRRDASYRPKRISRVMKLNDDEMM